MTLRNFLLALCVALFAGSASIFEKISLREAHPLTIFTIRSLFMTFCLLLICVFFQGIRPLFEVSAKTLLYTLIPAVLATAFVLIYFTVLKQDMVSRVVPITSMSPLFAVLLSVCFLSEPFSWKRMIGVLLIVSGLSLVR